MLSPTVPNTAGLNQADNAAPAGSPTTAPSPPQNQFRRPSEQPIGHGPGRRMSAALQRSVAGSVSQAAVEHFPLEKLPDEIRILIGAAAPSRDRIALALAAPHTMYQLIRNEVRAAFIVTMHAPTVNTLAGFNSLLRMIQDLPPAFQGGPLAALGARILYFPSK